MYSDFREVTICAAVQIAVSRPVDAWNLLRQFFQQIFRNEKFLFPWARPPFPAQVEFQDWNKFTKHQPILMALFFMAQILAGETDLIILQVYSEVTKKIYE